MIYRVRIVIDSGGRKAAPLTDSTRYAADVAQMWSAAGLNLRDVKGRAAFEVTPLAKSAIADMVARPRLYLSMHPPDGETEYRTALRALRLFLARLEEHPIGTVSVSW